MSDNRLALLRQIMELQFTAIELNLFLDTHPGDEEALRDIRTVNNKLLPLMSEYEKNYGPLTPFSANIHDREHWTWINEPWPWEIVY
jgi:spore coat protein JB